MLYDLIIVGGGPAGAGAGVYAARKKLKTLLIAQDFGGQSFVSESIENWIGTIKISGLELAKALESHVRAQEGIEIKMPEKVLSVQAVDSVYEVATDKGVYQAKTLVIATGGRRRRLGILGEEKFDGKGVVYCSTCDAPLFKNKTVAVIGGGNAGAEAVIDLIPYARQIYWVSHGPEFTADPITREEMKKSPKVVMTGNFETREITGDQFVSGVKYLDKSDNQLRELKVEGVFVEIGSVPNSEIVNGLVEMNSANEIVINPKTAETSRPGIFAAGDVTDEVYKQNNISAGDAVRAALSAYNYLLNIKKESPAMEK